jgi:NADP-dependent 3-hydroxy acid dehydrogenase YdfG
MNTSSTIPVVLITGAITRIGRATGLAFAREGAKLVVSGRRAAEGAKLAEDIRADTIVFVASQKASFISGASIPDNGGKAAL